MAISRKPVIDVYIGLVQQQSYPAYGCLVGVHEDLRRMIDENLVWTFGEYLCGFYEQDSRDSYLQHVDLSVRVRVRVTAMIGTKWKLRTRVDQP